MKRICSVMLAMGVAGSLVSGTRARADIGISAGVQVNAGVRVGAVADFEAPLASEGAWITLASYGHCWHPRGVAVSWRPYCDGEWVWTDEGWYWQSDESWSWACYHYGTWTYDAGYGWCWVPGVEWAPAWVNWRTGGGYIGWAPCAPGGIAVDVGAFAFVATARFAEPIRPGAIVIGNRDIAARTTVLAGTTRETINVGGSARNVAFNRGPAVADVQRATGREIRAVPARDAESRTRVPAEVMRRNAAPNNATRDARPPTQERTQPAPTRGVNPQPPETAPREVPNRQTGPRETPNVPAPNREVPNRQLTPRETPNTPAPNRESVPNRTAPERTAPPATREVPNPNREQPAPRETAPRETAPPKTEREPRSQNVAPPSTEKAPARVPTTAKPAHPSEPAHPAEEPKQSEPKKEEKVP